MRQLKDILYKVSITATSGDMDVNIREISFDSRKIKKDHLYVAIKGNVVDGQKFIPHAIDRGATVVVCEKLPTDLDKNVTYVEVQDSREALGYMASNFYNNPSSKLKLVGITGTNGKTTSATLLYHLFTKLGKKSGLLSTVKNYVGEKEFDATHTTPDPVAINQLMDKMVQSGCNHCFMEVSSHALHQKRTKGLLFKLGVFTNISHDHLDYHKSFDNYITSKKLLFDSLSSEAFALTNADDRRSSVMVQNTKASKKTYSLKSISDFKGRVISSSLLGIEMDIDNQVAWFQLIGDFNAYNVLAAYSSAVLLGEDANEVLTKLSSLSGVPGRFEKISNDRITGIVDYAHTPDALDNVLQTIEKVRTRNESVITIVGCGGNRDKDKRPLMAEIACRYSDKVIFTSDNPRDEDPEEIVKDMIKGLDPVNLKKTLSIISREEAIKAACMMAEEGDIILVAGKGHEDYQEIKGKRHPFDDREILKNILKNLAN